MPPLVSLKCPTAASQSKITLTAYTFEDDPELQFIWTVSPGTVVKGQHSDTITIDLTGLSGQTIKVMAEVFHKSGLAATATCEVRIHNSRSSPPEEYAFLQLHEFACASMMMRRMKAVELSGSRTILRAPTRQTGFTRSK